MKQITKFYPFFIQMLYLTIVRLWLYTNQIYLKVRITTKNRSKTGKNNGFRGFQIEWLTSRFQLRLQLTYIPNNERNWLKDATSVVLTRVHIVLNVPKKHILGIWIGAHFTLLGDCNSSIILRKISNKTKQCFDVRYRKNIKSLPKVKCQIYLH